MAGLLISGPAGAGKSSAALDALAFHSGPGVIVDFQTIYAALLLIERDSSGRYPERNPAHVYILPTVEFVRRAAIFAAVDRQMFAIVTNSSGDSGRRRELLGFMGSNASERIIDPGLDVVTERLSVNGNLSSQCSEAIQRWYGQL